jgi:ACDE family multidrug resistance protein
VTAAPLDVPAGPASIRRTLILVSAVVCFESLFFTVLAPLLPAFSQRLHLSVASAGLLSAAYASGALLAAVPSGLLVARLGSKRTTLVGQLVLGVASVGFGVAPDSAAVFGARVAQGCGCALAWTGGLTWLVSQVPRERRGAFIGLALGAGVAGALLGPAVGALASAVGTRLTFVLLAFPALALVVWGTTIPDGPPQALSLKTFRRALRHRSLLRPALLIGLAGLLLGMISVLAPLRLARLGWSAPAIAAVFLLTAAAQTSINPGLGRWADSHGRILPLRLALVLSALGTIGLAVDVGGWLYFWIVFAAGVAFGLLWTPSMALLSDASSNLDLGLAVAFALINLAWPPGQLVGSAGAGLLVQIGSQHAPYLAACALCLAGLLASRA